MTPEEIVLALTEMLVCIRRRLIFMHNEAALNVQLSRVQFEAAHAIYAIEDKLKHCFDTDTIKKLDLH